MRPFDFCAFRGIGGEILLANCGTRIATEADLEWFWREAEFELDRLTLEMCTHARAQGNPLEDWMLVSELDAFFRIRERAA